jgi:hypothetical protein
MSVEDADGCTTPDTQLHVSIDDLSNTTLVNMHSLHVGIVNFFPFIFGRENRPEVIDRLFSMLEDE